MRLYKIYAILMPSMLLFGSAEGFALPHSTQNVPNRRDTRIPTYMIAASSSNLKSFVEYAEKDLGVRLNGVAITVQDGLRGVVAAGPVRENTEFIAVPAKNCLVTTTDQACPFRDGWVDRAWWRKSLWAARLALILLKEKIKGAESPLAPWISQLPTQIPIPMTWNQASLDELQYDNLVSSVKKQRQEWTGLYDSLVASSPQIRKDVTSEQFDWALSIAYSRAFSGPYEGRGPKGRIAEVAFVSVLAILYLASGLGNLEQVANGAGAVLISIPIRDFFMSKMAGLKRYALTPGIDFANHGGTEAGEVSYNYFYDYFFALTGRSFSPASEVLISYGKRSNDHLLQYYGFVEKDNVYDVYVVEDFIQKAASALGADLDQERLSILTAATDISAPASSLILCREGLGNAASISPALRLLCLKDDQLVGKKAEQITLKDFQTELSPANEKSIWLLAAAVARKELEALGGTIATDEAVLQGVGKAFSEERTLAVQFRIEKKKVLEKAASSLEKAAAAR